MNALVQEWIEKAEGDFRTAQREARVRKQPNHEAVCFHSQQCAEKYLKAYLQEQQIYFPKNSQPHQAARAWFAKRRLARMAFESLNKYAVEFRYPGETATHVDARYALSVTKRVRAFLREKLGLPT